MYWNCKIKDFSAFFGIFARKCIITLTGNSTTYMTAQQKTRDICVKVESYYQPTTSIPEDNHFVFAYRVTINNRGNRTVRLLRRHWQIIEGNGSKREVEGQGVIGEQPVIEPGNSHSYFSGCNLQSPVGKMYGTYTMERLIDGEQFTVNIPEFVMTAPHILN